MDNMKIEIIPNIRWPRKSEIVAAAIRTERMRMARFYFCSKLDEIDDSPDLRDADTYFNEITDPNHPEKLLVRHTIKTLVPLLLYTYVQSDLHLNVLEKMSFNLQRLMFKKKMEQILDQKQLLRWPRIYIERYDPQKDKVMRITVQEEQCNNGTEQVTSEIDYKEKPTIAKIDFNKHPPTDFKYKPEQIYLKFITNLTDDIQALIVKKLKKKFRKGGFSAHHIITRKKLEFYHDVHYNWVFDTGNTFSQSILGQKHKQRMNLTRLADQFIKSGVQTTVRPVNSDYVRWLLCPQGNIFYGPSKRSDDMTSSTDIDVAAEIVLSEEEMNSIRSLDKTCNNFLKECGITANDFSARRNVTNALIERAHRRIEANLRINWKFVDFIQEVLFELFDTFLKIAINHEISHLPQMGIPFDPRLVDRKEGEEKWFYRRRKVVKKIPLPKWFQNILEEVSQELQVEINIDTASNGAVANPDSINDLGFNTLSIKPRIGPQFIADVNINYKTFIITSNNGPHFIADVNVIYVV